MKKVLLHVILALLLLSPSPAFSRGYSSGGGRSYSSGSRGFSSSSFSRSSSSSFSRPSPVRSSPSYSSGSRTSSYSSKPTTTFQSSIAKEQHRSEARTQYQKATAPKPAYTTSKGASVPIKPGSPSVSQIREMPEDKYASRKTREQKVFHHYYNTSPSVVHHYNDSYNTFFWLWLMDRSVNDRAAWAYNHAPGTPNGMDEVRYKELLARDKVLEARVKELEKEKKVRDPTYVPPGLDDPDLQYTDEYVNAVYNPQPKGMSWSGFFHGLWVFVKWCFYLTLIGGVIYLVFFKRW